MTLEEIDNLKIGNKIVCVGFKGDLLEWTIVSITGKHNNDLWTINVRRKSDCIAFNYEVFLNNHWKLAPEKLEIVDLI